MGNLVALFSTIILVSTVGTVIFAVFAYIVSRRPGKRSSHPPPREIPTATPPPPAVIETPATAVVMERRHDEAPPAETPAVQAPPTPATEDTTGPFRAFKLSSVTTTHPQEESQTDATEWR
jgi:hypothetical protein